MTGIASAAHRQCGSQSRQADEEIAGDAVCYGGNELRRPSLGPNGVER
jgi:hypothetical protein